MLYCERHGDALPAPDIDTWNVEPFFDKVLVVPLANISFTGSTSMS
jgi:hypothetical protein